MTRHFDVLVGQKGAGLSRCVRARIVMVNNDASSLFVFRISPKTLGKQIVVNHSELTVLRYSTVASLAVLPKKQVTICFQVLLPRTSFVEFGSSSTTRTVDYSFASGLYAQIHDLSHVTILSTFFEAPRSYFSNISLHQAIVKLCGIQREQIFFTARCSCNIECMYVQ